MRTASSPWVDLEHQLHRELRLHGIFNDGVSPPRIVVGFSGGADSLALLWALLRLKYKVVGCHVHHGSSSLPEIQTYRHQAAKFCEDFCTAHQIPFELREASGASLVSEEELRNYRHHTLQKVKVETGSEFLALGHHRDDLLETRLLRLIRGTGPQGLQAMQFRQESLLRPWLQTPKAKLMEYLEQFSLTPLEDPSNQQTEPFRNWIREQWLPELEQRQLGATASLSRSLELLTAAVQPGVLGKTVHEDVGQVSSRKPAEDPLGRAIFSADALSRVGLLSLSKSQQKQALAQFVYSQNKRDFTHAHIEEVLKRLDNCTNELLFRVGGLDWYVNAQQISLRKFEKL